MPAGRPTKLIDWDIVEKMIVSQCTAAEIAGHFHMHPSTFYRAVNEKTGLNFENYALSFYSKGKGNLRLKQYQKAMDGNTSLLLKLGEVYLGQAEKKQTTDTQIDLVDYQNLLMQFKALEEENKRLKDDNPNSGICYQPKTEPELS